MKYIQDYAMNFKFISRYRKKKISNRFDTFNKNGYHRECPFCHKKRRAGYIFACLECSIYREIVFQLRGLAKYLEKQNVYLNWKINADSVIIHRSMMGYNGYLYTSDIVLPVDKLNEYSKVKPLEELLTIEIANNFGLIEGRYLHVP